MGLITNVVFFPVTGPLFGIKWSLGKVQQAVEEELTDDAAVKNDFMALQMELELGQIDDDEYRVREAGIMQRFREVREWRERLGKSVSGGPVRVARDAEG